VKGLDTNVLLRYLTLDDKEQADLAAREIDAAEAAGERMLIQPLVLCEMVWVLESAYRFGKHEILTILERILMTAQFEIAQKEIVWAALGDYRRGKGDFSDHYVGRANEKHGASLTLTFDKVLKGEPRFPLLAR
jgi:predicted nucleic-acid-binding protein